MRCRFDPFVVSNRPSPILSVAITSGGALVRTAQFLREGVEHGASALRSDTPAPAHREYLSRPILIHVQDRITCIRPASLYSIMTRRALRQRVWPKKLLRNRCQVPVCLAILYTGSNKQDSKQ